MGEDIKAQFDAGMREMRVDICVIGTVGARKAGGER